MNLIKQIFDSKVIRRSVGWVFYLVLLVFLYNYIQSIDFDQLANIEANLLLLALASLLSLSYRYWGAVIWLVLLRDLGAKITNYRLLFYVYAKSWLGRYLPGKVTWILGRIYFASEQGVSKSSLAMSATIESGLQVAVTMALSLLFLSLDSRFDVISGQLRIAMLVGAFALLIILSPKLFNLIFKFIYLQVKKQQLTLSITNTTLAKGVLFYVVSYLISGAAYFLFAKAIYSELDLSSMLYIIGAFNLAGVIGILAFFAPSGLGVREGIQLLLLSAIMPNEIALVLTIASRLWAVVIDFIFFSCTYIFQRSVKRQASSVKTPPLRLLKMAISSTSSIPQGMWILHMKFRDRWQLVKGLYCLLTRLRGLRLRQFQTFIKLWIMG